MTDKRAGVFLCLLTVVLQQSLSFRVAPESLFTKGLIQLKSERERQEEIREKQDVLVGELTGVKQTVSTMKEEMKSLEERKDNETKLLSQMKEQMESIVSSQSHLTFQLSSLTRNVSQSRNKEVEDLKADVEKIKKKGVDTRKRVDSVNTTMDEVERSLEKLKIEPTSCAEIRSCEQTQTDGEFWLYPTILDGKRVKVFCSGLNTTEPEEFVTLHNTNDGEYPNVTNPGCYRETSKNHPKKKLIGHVKFHKIRVNITTLEVIMRNFKFAEGAGNRPGFGHARDCYTASRRCGPKGHFNIDTRKTGLRVSLNQTWIKEGNGGAALVNREEEGQVIKLKCGGYCGGCYPKRWTVKLELSPDEGLPDAAAKKIKCPVYKP